MTIHQYKQCDRKGCKSKYHELPVRSKLYDYKGWLTFYRLSGVDGEHFTAPSTDVMPDGETHYCSEKCLKLALEGMV